MGKTPKGKTHLAGLGNRHRLQRDRLLRLHIDGSGCPECGRPIFRDKDLNPGAMPLHADHWPIPRAIAGPHALASRLTCGPCNLSAGGRLRAELAAGHSEPVEPDRTGLAFAWP